jgi:hypothetical protein
MTSDLLGNDGTEAPPLGRRDHLTFRGNVSNGRHGWLRLTPAYSLHVVRSLVDQPQDAGLVLDPFSGTGTTPLVCSSLGIPCHAVDVNPFLIWLGNLKVSPFASSTPEDLRIAGERIVCSLKDHGEASEIWVPNLHSIEKWWHEPRTLHNLAALYGEIVRSDAAEITKDLLKVAFCKVMIQSANVSFGHQSMSFKRPSGNGQLTFLDDFLQKRESFQQSFIKSVEDIAHSISTDVPMAQAAIFHGDSRDLRAVLPRLDYQRVVTSPPYPNRMSYIRELRPYMYWLGFLHDGRQAGELDWKAIGGTWGCATSLLGTWKAGARRVPFDGFETIVASIGENHSLLGRYVHRYFEDMMMHIASLKGVLAPGATCHYIVGNSKFYETLLPVEQIYAALFKAEGFEDVSVETIRKRTSKRELYEYVVHAVKPAPN